MQLIFVQYMKTDQQIFTQQLGNNIRKHRLAIKMTVEDLAIDAGLAYSQVSRIELGKIKTSAYTVYLLSKALNVSIAVLYDVSLEEDTI